MNTLMLSASFQFAGRMMPTELQVFILLLSVLIAGIIILSNNRRREVS